MFKKLIKNSLITLMLLSYAPIAISMDQPKPSLFSTHTKKFLSDIAPYFTYKKKFIGVQLGIIAAYETLSLLDFKSSSSAPWNFMDFSQLYPSISKKMNFDGKIFLNLSDCTSIAGILSFGGAHIITMNPGFYNNSSEAEKIFVMGHEIVHAKNYHTELKGIAALGIFFGTSSALIAYDKITQALFQKVEKILKLDEKSYFSRMLHFLKTSNHAIATAPLVHWFLGKYLYYKFSQSLEIQADRESAQLLDCAQGGISFFENRIAQKAAQPSISWSSYLNPFTALKLINHRLGFLDHPSHEERIALLKKYL